jgi:hypothetical protein
VQPPGAAGSLLEDGSQLLSDRRVLQIRGPRSFGLVAIVHCTEYLHSEHRTWICK